jgi:hypothetical protein
MTKQVDLAAEYRRLKEKHEHTFKLALPSGAVWEVRRPPLQTWTMTGTMPAALVEESLKAEKDRREISEVITGLSPQEGREMLRFMRLAVEYAVVNPRLAPGGGEGCLDPDEVCEEDFVFVAGWVIGGCPEIPVPLKGGGATDMRSLKRFRQERRKPAPRRGRA